MTSSGTMKTQAPILRATEIAYWALERFSASVFGLRLTRLQSTVPASAEGRGEGVARRGGEGQIRGKEVEEKGPKDQKIKGGKDGGQRCIRI